MRPPSRRPSLSLRIRLAFLALGLIAIILTGALALHIAEDALETTTYERLTGIRESKKRQVESHLAEALAFAGALGRNESAVDALRGFQAAWPPSSSEYHEVRALHHEGLAGLTEALGFEDLLLIESASGRVLYSARSGPELGRSLTEPDLAATSLAAAFRSVVAGDVRPQLADYSLYPVEQSVAAFATAPVLDNGAVRGLLAARLSIAKIDEVMTGGGRWKEEGLGASGETYLVGRDQLMRSDSRFFIESPKSYLDRLRTLGVSSEQISLLQSRGTTVLTQRIETEAVRRALAGETATSQIVDYREIEVLSSFTPLRTPGLGWVLLSEIDSAEAFAPVAELRRHAMLLALAVSAAFLALGYVFSLRTTRPLLALTRAVERLGRDDWREVGTLADFEKADDEVARLAQQFDEVSRRLQQTTVSRDYLDGLLESMLNAVFTIGPVTAEAADQVPILLRSANPAALKLLGYGEDEMNGLTLDRLLGSGSTAPSWLETLRREGRTPTVEKTLRTKDGREIPVLFTAALVRPERSASRDDVVCVAQDITDLKQAERQLQALTSRLLSAQEEERGRLARELHDDVTQRLGALASDTSRLVLSQMAAPDLRESLGALREQAIRLADDVQLLSRRLHPSILDDLGVAAALRAEAQALRERTGLAVSFAGEEPPPDFPQEAALALYRIAQECLRNVARHAQASEVNIELSVLDGRVRLRIEDDGTGFDLSGARRQGGLGLVSMSERARLAGGRLDVCAQPGSGTKITAEVPLSPPMRYSAE